VLGEGFRHILVDGKKGLAGAPIHLADELTAKSVDDAGNGRSGSLANEIEIEHALDSLWLHTTAATVSMDPAFSSEDVAY